MVALQADRLDRPTVEVMREGQAEAIAAGEALRIHAIRIEAALTHPFESDVVLRHALAGVMRESDLHTPTIAKRSRRAARTASPQCTNTTSAAYASVRISDEVSHEAHGDCRMSGCRPA